MKRQVILEVDTNGPLKVRKHTIVHTGQSSSQQTQKDGTEEEVKDVFPIIIQEDKEDVTFGSFNSKSSPQPLGHTSSQVKLKDGLMSLRRNCTRSIRLLHKCTNRKGGKAAFANLQSNVKVLKIKKFRHKDHTCAICSSSKTYSNTRSRLLAMKIVRNASPRSVQRNWTRNIHLVHKFISWKGGKATLAKLQRKVKALEIMKLRHKDCPSPSQWATSSPKTYSITQQRLLAMKIARIAFPTPLDKSTNAPGPQEHKLRTHKRKHVTKKKCI